MNRLGFLLVVLLGNSCVPTSCLAQFWYGPSSATTVYPTGVPIASYPTTVYSPSTGYTLAPTYSYVSSQPIVTTRVVSSSPAVSMQWAYSQPAAQYAWRPSVPSAEQVLDDQFRAQRPAWQAQTYAPTGSTSGGNYVVFQAHDLIYAADQSDGRIWQFVPPASGSPPGVRGNWHRVGNSIPLRDELP